MKSSIFLANLTVVDHAYIDRNGQVLGGSFNPSFLVSGETDNVEKVVVDFSTVKKDLKILIDHKVTGIDHKLWITRESSATLTPREPEGETAMVLISTPCLKLDIPGDAVVVLDCGYSIEAIGVYLGNYLTNALGAKYPSIKVTCLNSTKVHSLNSSLPVSTFSYVHGLKDSTSWGCQNNSHGHLSYLQLFPSKEHVREYENGRTSPSYPEESGIDKLRRVIARDLDGTVFVRKENFKGIEDGMAVVGYSSRDRGTFHASYDVKTVKVKILESETTIEFLVEYVMQKYVEDFRRLGIHSFAISEGLTKGAYKEIFE